MEKRFKTIEQQIQILKSRNMKISDYERAYNILIKNNYYYLINGYKKPFLDNASKIEKFVESSKIEEIYSLYTFDKNIKINLLKYLLKIENEIDTYISYEFSKNYGHKNYLIINNFDNLESKKSIIKKFIIDINSEIQHQYKNANEMIVHYMDKYKYIPLWVLVRILSFGKISKFYSFMKVKEQNAISRKYNLTPSEFQIMLRNLTLVRNICAHDEKLYDIQLKSRIRTTLYHKKLAIVNKEGNYQLGTRDLFSIMIILKILLEKQDFEVFYKEIIKDIKKLEKEIKSIKINDILDKMGFPKIIENYYIYKQTINIIKWGKLVCIIERGCMSMLRSGHLQETLLIIIMTQ